MRKIICVIAVMGLTVAWAAPAQAASHNIDSTVKLSAIEETGSPPVSGSAHYAGTIKGTLGSGAVVGTNVFGPVGVFTGTLRVYLNKGTITGTLEGTGGPAQGGGLDFSGTGEVTKGSGKYKGAHGKFTFTGGQPADSTVATQQIEGSVKY
jgi:hypothetical protein